MAEAFRRYPVNEKNAKQKGFSAMVGPLLMLVFLDPLKLFESLCNFPVVAFSRLDFWEKREGSLLKAKIGNLSEKATRFWGLVCHRSIKKLSEISEIRIEERGRPQGGEQLA